MPFKTLKQKKDYAKKWRERNPLYMKDYLKAYSKLEKRKEYLKEYLKEYSKKYLIKYRSLEKYKEKARIRAKLHNKRHPIKYKARYMIRNAVSLGKIIKPLNCSYCNLPCKCQAHHNNYRKPLQVIWLCPEHHRQADKHLIKL